jgi:hypothetical protein
MHEYSKRVARGMLEAHNEWRGTADDDHDLPSPSTHIYYIRSIAG